jgi:hypothetical protein
VKRLALLAALIAAMALGAATTVASAGNDTPGCTTKTYDLSYTYDGEAPIEGALTLVRCVTKGGDGVFTLSGNGHLDGCGNGALTGTATGADDGMDVNITLTVPSGFCFGGTTVLTGTMNWGSGGGGTFLDNGFFTGTWTATRTH